MTNTTTRIQMANGSPPNIGAIDLTPQEAALCEAMTFRQEDLGCGRYTAQENGELACRLMKALLARGAIPPQRLSYFSNPTYRSGYPRGSRQQLFERNGTIGDEIYRHPNFLDYMRYFLFGAQLPEELIEGFSAEAFGYGHVGPSDALELGKLAGKLVKRHGLVPHDVEDEFYRLALDCGIYQSHAAVIRKSVHNIR
jgi:hypothetical protein